MLHWNPGRQQVIIDDGVVHDATQKGFQDPSPLAAGEMLDLSHSQVE